MCITQSRVASWSCSYLQKDFTLSRCAFIPHFASFSIGDGPGVVVFHVTLNRGFDGNMLLNSNCQCSRSCREFAWHADHHPHAFNNTNSYYLVFNSACRVLLRFGAFVGFRNTQMSTELAQYGSCSVTSMKTNACTFKHHSRFVMRRCGSLWKRRRPFWAQLGCAFSLGRSA